MTSADFVAEVASETGFAKAQVKSVQDAMAKVILGTMAHAREKETVIIIPRVIQVTKTKKKATKARMGRNPSTGESIKIKAKPAHMVVKARILSLLKD